MVNLASIAMYCSATLWAPAVGVVAFGFAPIATAQENGRETVQYTAINSLPSEEEDESLSTTSGNEFVAQNPAWSPAGGQGSSFMTRKQLAKRSPPVAGALTNLFVSIIALPVLLPFIALQQLKDMFE
eukprot:CAMPEP_0116033722 /NCGR_PEP_ID=MMETSP0321-20121206/19168_1 /TAXON_ID=163516 /ORGANISM="Leptocylindrus danicus var. danicus, Strain B650" /LENGTH=127 /DNA_ID=CAMNT_0003509871 /DNA_START=48 /DNA_END=431 /DNA_ORIENTATION=+